jgi:HPt (histidine-containing phosphotransfer) domain-containing protein
MLLPEKSSAPLTPEPVFEQDLFDELRDILGDARTRVFLNELASALLKTFPENPPPAPDRTQTFEAAHMLTGRAGFMGFTALQKACADLQHACATQAPFGAEYDRSHGIARATRDVIMSLISTQN